MSCSVDEEGELVEWAGIRLSSNGRSSGVCRGVP